MSFDESLREPMSCAPSLVSMQSHVSYGHVGNSVATFALQRLGCEVTPLHTVMYSSHLGYEGWRGDHVLPDTLRALIEGLAHVGALATPQALLLGFLATPAHGKVAQELRERMSPDALIVVDPVMGDHGSLYVTEALVEFYRDVLPGGVDVLVPNVFELGVLTQRAISGVQDAREALASLERDYRYINPEISPLLVVKGVPEPSDTGHLYILARHDGEELAWRTPRFSQRFAGAGDLFTATLTAHLLLGDHIHEAVACAIATTSEVLEATHLARRAELALIDTQRAFSQTAAHRMRRAERVGL